MAEGSTLTATSRPSRTSCARYTSPIPPAPRGPRITYGPSVVPSSSAMDQVYVTADAIAGGDLPSLPPIGRIASRLSRRLQETHGPCKPTKPALSSGADDGPQLPQAGIERLGAGRSVFGRQQAAARGLEHRQQ